MIFILYDYKNLGQLAAINSSLTWANNKRQSEIFNSAFAKWNINF